MARKNSENNIPVLDGLTKISEPRFYGWDSKNKRSLYAVSISGVRVNGDFVLGKGYVDLKTLELWEKQKR